MKSAYLVILVSLLLATLVVSHKLFDIPDEEVKDCTKPGYFCETCTSSVVCIQTSEDFAKVNRINCSELGQTCTDGHCTSDSNPSCDRDDSSFPCSAVGMFPHPTHWNKFEICIPADLTGFQNIEVTCEDDYAYNPKTTYCDIPLSTIKDNTYPIPLCENDTVVKPLERNPTIFYSCQINEKIGDVLYPFQFLCPHGLKFDKFTCN